MDFSSLPTYFNPSRPVAPDPIEVERSLRIVEAAAIRRLRLWRRVMFGGWLLAIPMAIVGGWLDLPFGLLPLISGFLFWIGMCGMAQIMCPRCGRPYQCYWGKVRVFITLCVHCDYLLREPEAPSLYMTHGSKN